MLAGLLWRRDVHTRHGSCEERRLKEEGGPDSDKETMHHPAPVLQTPGPPTEPRNPETPKVHVKVRKMPF